MTSACAPGSTQCLAGCEASLTLTVHSASAAFDTSHVYRLTFSGGLSYDITCQDGRPSPGQDGLVCTYADGTTPAFGAIVNGDLRFEWWLKPASFDVVVQRDGAIVGGGHVAPSYADAGDVCGITCVRAEETLDVP